MHCTSTSAARSHLRDDTIRSTMQWFLWFCCQKVPPLSWCRALPLLLVLSPPTSAGSPFPCCRWCKLPPAVTAGRLCGSCTAAVTAAESLLASQRPLVCHRTVRLCTNCRWSGETQEGHYCKSVLHLNSKATSETQLFKKAQYVFAQRDTGLLQTPTA